MAAHDGDVSTTTPEEFAKILKVDFEKWLAVISANGTHDRLIGGQSWKVTLNDIASRGSV